MHVNGVDVFEAELSKLGVPHGMEYYLLDKVSDREDYTWVLYRPGRASPVKIQSVSWRFKHILIDVIKASTATGLQPCCVAILIRKVSG